MTIPGKDPLTAAVDEYQDLNGDPDADAEALSGQVPELTLRVEPAQALRTWADEQGIDDKRLSPKPENLGVRITYLASGPPCETWRSRATSPYRSRDSRGTSRCPPNRVKLSRLEEARCEDQGRA